MVLFIINFGWNFWFRWIAATSWRSKNLHFKRWSDLQKLEWKVKSRREWERSFDCLTHSNWTCIRGLNIWRSRSIRCDISFGWQIVKRQLCFSFIRLHIALSSVQNSLYPFYRMCLLLLLLLLQFLPFRCIHNWWSWLSTPDKYFEADQQLKW